MLAFHLNLFLSSSSCNSCDRVTITQYRGEDLSTSWDYLYTKVACDSIAYLVEIVIIVGGVSFAFVVAKVVFCHFFFATNHLCRQLPGLSFSVFLSMTSMAAPQWYSTVIFTPNTKSEVACAVGGLGKQHQEVLSGLDMFCPSNARLHSYRNEDIVHA